MDSTPAKQQPKSTIGQYLLNALHQRGVEHIFGVPGDYVLRFDKCIEEHPSIQFINTTRESTAGYMADAYARLRGLGVACITYGVGINITNALAQAYVENSPLVVISGAAGAAEFLKQIKLHHLINKANATLGDTTQLEIFKQVTIGQAVLTDPKTAQQQIDAVLDLCFKTKRPVYIEIPRDMVDAKLSPETAPVLAHDTQSNMQTLDEAMQEVEQMLSRCQRPMLWIGHEIQRYGLAPTLLQFAERYHIPIVTSLLGKTAVSEHHALFAGVYQGDMSSPEVMKLMDQCDCVFMLGLLLSDVDTGIFTAKLDHERRIIASAETFEIGHHHYKKLALNDFIKRLNQLPLEKTFAKTYSNVNTRKKLPFTAHPKTKITTKYVFDCIQHHLQRDHIVVTDIGDSLFGSADLILEQDSFMACAYFGSLGFATPASIAAQLARPKRRVIGIVGDGAFQMTSMELSTAVRYQLDPIIIVLNNHGYGTERPILEGTYNDIQDWNYAAIPQVLQGGVGIKVTTEDGFEEALLQAMQQRGTFYLIEVDLDKLDFSPAMHRFEALVAKNSAKQSGAQCKTL